MAWFSRALCVLVPLLLLFAAAHVWPEWFRSLGLDFGRLLQDVRILYNATEVRPKLEAQRIRLLHAITEKDRIAGEIVSRRLPLLEAARRFRALKQDAGAWDTALGLERGASRDERLCRHVIHWTEAVLGEGSEEARRVATRLEEELQEELRRTGSVSVP